MGYVLLDYFAGNSILLEYDGEQDVECACDMDLDCYGNVSPNDIYGEIYGVLNPLWE